MRGETMKVVTLLIPASTEQEEEERVFFPEVFDDELAWDRFLVPILGVPGAAAEPANTI